jgi:hypothetical protein
MTITEKPSLLLAGCSKRPGMPTQAFPPPGSLPYKVKAGDDWWKLAARPESQQAGLDALGLCHFNFQTKVPAEINWYLRNYVGCARTTPDKKNYTFSSEDAPGIVYLPAGKSGGVTPPVPAPGVVPLPPPVKIRTNSWLGIGAKFGSQVVIVGIENMGAFVFSIEDLVNAEPNIRAFELHSEGNRFGPGVGASGGACLVYITSASSPSQLHGHQSSGKDWNLALGGNAGSVVKTARGAAKLNKLRPIIQFLRRVNAVTPSALKKALTQPDKLGDLYKLQGALRETLANDSGGGEPEILVVDLPLSGGTEISIYWQLSTFTVLAQQSMPVNWAGGAT